MSRNQVGRTSEHALSFGRAVGDYDRGRPSYPDAAVDWIVAHLSAPPGQVLDAVDIGAGTGKFTASLVARGLTTSAVEPIPEMRARLIELFPSVTAVEGTAEAIPLPDASVDLVTFAQAWHWVEYEVASREVARVLRPDGALALVWNIRDDTVDWVATLGDIMGSSAAEQYDSVSPSVATPLELAEHAEFRWENPMTRDELMAMITSRSYVITMDPDDRTQMLGEIANHLDTHPALAGRTEYVMPYVTRVTLARSAS